MESISIGNRKCGTCKYWDGNKPQNEQHFSSNSAGYKCLFVVPYWVRPLPSAWSAWTIYNDGVSCPTWERNEQQSKVQGNGSGDTRYDPQR